MSYTIKELPKTERPRERLKEFGSASLSDKELLAIILKTGTREKNVSELAIEILKLYKVADFDRISLTDLQKIKGIGEVKAIELLATIELGKRIFLKEKVRLDRLDSPTKIYQSTKYLFANCKQEKFYALYFNSKQELLSQKLLFIGTINESIVHPRELFKEAYNSSASFIVCLHNHPSNDPTPSKADKLFTQQIQEIGKIHGIPVLDHIIVGNDNYYSFFEHQKEEK